jgi:hypothetical protein
MNIQFFLKNSKGSKEVLKKFVWRLLAPLGMRDEGQKVFALIL